MNLILNTVNKGLHSYILRLMNDFVKGKMTIQKDGQLSALISLVKASACYITEICAIVSLSYDSSQRYELHHLKGFRSSLFCGLQYVCSEF